MGYFESPVFHEIGHLVKNLGKGNVAATVEELKRIVSLYGMDAKVFCISCLLHEIDLRLVDDEQQQRGTQVPADMQCKMQVLSDEAAKLWELLDYQSFTVCMREALEGAVELAGQKQVKVRSTFNVVRVKELEIVCSKIFKLNTAQQICVGIGFSSSIRKDYSDEGARFLVSTLFGSMDMNDRDADSLLVSQVVWILQRHPVLLSDSDLGNSCMLALQSQLPETFKKLAVAPLMVKEPLCVDDLKRAEAFHVPSLGEIGLALGPASLLEDLGCATTSSSEALKSVLVPFLTDRKEKLRNQDVTSVLAMMARTQSKLVNSPNDDAKRALHLSLFQDFVRSGSQGSKHVEFSSNDFVGGWDVGTFIHVAKELSGETIDGRVVISEFANAAEELTVNSLDKMGFDLIVKAFKFMNGGRPLPGEALLVTSSPKTGEVWRHKATQMALLRHAVNASPEDVSFKGLHEKRPTVKPPKGANLSSNGAWESVDVVSTLDTLSGSGFYQEVKALIDPVIQQLPESLLLSLLQIDSPFDSLREETYAVLLPQYLQSIKNGDQPLDTKKTTVKEIWRLNHYVLLRALVALYAKDANSLPFVVNLVQEQEDGMSKFLDLPITTLVFDAICYASKNFSDQYQLDSWLSARTKAVGDAQGVSGLQGFSRNLLSFVKRKLDAPSSSTVGEPLGKTQLNSIFGALRTIVHIARGYISEDFVIEMNKVYEACNLVPPSRSASASGTPPQAARDERTNGNQPVPDRNNQTVLEANSLLNSMFRANKQPSAMLQVLLEMKLSPDAKQQELFSAVVHALMEKYANFAKSDVAAASMDTRTLQLTGFLVGSLIQRKMISSMALGISLRYVIEALRKPPSSPLFKFGVFALEQFRQKLIGWPQTASQIVKIPHMRKFYPELVQDLESALAGGPNAVGAAVGNGDGAIVGRETASVASQVNRALQQPVQPPLSPPVSSNKLRARESYPLRGTELAEDLVVFGEQLDRIIRHPEHVSESLDPPNEETEDKLTFLINNLSPRNVDDKVLEMKQVLKAEFFPWIAYFLVAKRVSTQGNLHGLYMSFLDKLGEQKLLEEVRNRTLFQAKVFLNKVDIVSSTSERLVLKHLGSWLGRLTLGKNKPLFHRELDLKGLLVCGYERGWLIAVVPFAAKILDSCKSSKVFTKSNPWVVGLLRTMAELYELQELKLNLKFEIEVLCKSLSVDLKAIEPSNILSFARKPRLESNPDFNFKVDKARVAPSSPGLQQPPPAQQAQQQQPQQQRHQSPSHAPQQPSTGAMNNAGALQQQQQPPKRGEEVKANQSQHMAAIPERTEIPNLAAYVHINPSLPLFAQHGNLRRVVPVAVDRAIREIIQPVVERSVTIACITTREMIMKDFAMEPDEKRMRKAAHLMVSNLAGALALVTCKEPLRASMGSHLRQLLDQVSPREDEQAVELAAATCATDNLELGCMLIEKAATEKAMRDIDEQIEGALNQRRESREQRNQPFFDMSVFQSGNRYPNGLPEPLRPTPRPQGLTVEQLRVYELFQRSPRQPIVPPNRASVGPGGLQGKLASVKPGMPTKNGPALSPTGPQLTAQQALQEWKVCLSQLERSMQEVVAQSPGGRTAALNRFPRDHDVIKALKDMRSIGNAAIPSQRDEPIRIIVQHVFKRLYDINAGEKFRFEVHFAMLEILRDMTLDPNGLRKTITEWVIFAPPEHKLNKTVTVGLIKTKLINVKDFDVYLSKLMEGGHQVSAVMFAIDIVRECILANRFAAVTDFLNTLDTLQQVVVLSKPSAQGQQPQLQEIPGLQQLLESVRIVATSEQHQQQQQKLHAAQTQPLQGQGGPQEQQLQPGFYLRSPDQQGLRQQVAKLLHRWIQICNQPEGPMPESVHRPYLTLLQQQNALKGNENARRFFRITTELCIESSLTPTPGSQENGNVTSRNMPRKELSYVAVDAFSKLVLLLIKYADLRERPALLAIVLDVIAGVLCREFMLRTQKQTESFLDQRPYYRLLLNLQQDLVEEYDNEGLSHDHLLAILATFAEIYQNVLQPNLVPILAFSWLDLISHRSFLPRLLKTQGSGWIMYEEILVSLFRFLHPYLKESQLTTSVRVLYKGTLRVLLVLLHDFPEFLCAYHFSFCDVIPTSCIQLRNLVLSAFPRSMQLVDPFKKGLRVEELPDTQRAPSLNSKYEAVLTVGNLRNGIDEFLERGQPAHFPAELQERMVQVNPVTRMREYKVRLINSVVLYVGVQSIASLQKLKDGMGTQKPLLAILHENSSMSSLLLFRELANNIDPEGRYAFVDAIANQLRFPSSHTYFFSSMLLYLFEEGATDLVREQITRVLLERLIVHRPHPWGVLITFIEIINNPRFGFWEYNFTQCAPEISRLFQSVAQSCETESGNLAAAAAT